MVHVENTLKEKFSKKNILFLINSESYSPKSVLLRFLFVAVIALLIAHIPKLMVEDGRFTPQQSILQDIMFIVGFYALSEGSLLITRLVSKSKRVRFTVGSQCFIVLVYSLAVAISLFKVAELVFHEDNLLQFDSAKIVLMVGVFFIIFIHVLRLFSKLVSEVIEAHEEITMLKQAKLQSDYNLLQDRLNPHFLFNNLSVLKSLIRYSPDIAEKFTQDFTDVYRYVLKCHEKKTITVKEEMEFVESYIALHKERIGAGLIISHHIEDRLMYSELPPMSIQLLIENAIKHNIASRAMPLTIEIYSSEDRVFVKNNLNLKNTTYSTQTGLSTLQAQYQMISSSNLEIEKTDTVFCISLPLLSV